VSLDASPLDDPDVFVDGVPHDLLARLRSEQPVHWHPDGFGGGRFVVTSHRFVRQLNRDWPRFSSVQLTVAGGDSSQRRAGPITLLESDPPEHTAMRRLVSRGFTPRAITELEQTADAVAAQLVHDFVAANGGDVADALAAQLPLHVTGEMLGIPYDDRAAILHWTSTTMGATDPEQCPSPAAAADAIQEYMAYGRRHIDRRRAQPGEDVFSALVHAEYDGAALTDDELLGWWQLLVTGSTETTRNLLSSGLLLLLEHRDQAWALTTDPALLDAAIDEMLRVITPVLHHQRRVTTRVEHESGVTFHPGQIVDLWMVAANRDPEVFDDPNTFDITRPGNDHLSFGSGGPHFCLGANLARQEARAFFTALLPYLDRIERAGPVARLRSSHFNSLKHLPVVVRG
jgi:cholest-4-en-3-one 26-monooxygenase